MPEKPTIVQKRIVANSHLFKIEALDLQFSNGEKRTFERLTRGHSGGAVLIVPMYNDETVLLVREYAAGVDRYELGLPKGRSEPGEAALDAANRELMEEVGYGARNLRLLTSLTVAPGYLEHSTDIVLARDLYEQKYPGDEPEELEVVPWRLDNISALVKSDECTEARSIASLYLTLEYLKNERT